MWVVGFAFGSIHTLCGNVTSAFLRPRTAQPLFGLRAHATNISHSPE